MSQTLSIERTEPLRIGFVSQPGHTVLPPAGSLEIWIHEVARRLAVRGHDVVVYASRVGDSKRAEADGVRYRFVDHSRDRALARALRPPFRLLPSNRAFFASPLHPLLYWVGVAKAAADDGREAVHVSNYSQALPFLRRRLPDAVLALHMQCEWLSQLAYRPIRSRLNRADLVLGCSAYITTRIGTRFPEYTDRLATLYNGVDVRPPPRNGPEDRVRLLHVGRISPEKGLHVLFDAFNELVEHHPHLSLTLVGEESPIPTQMALDLFDDASVEELRPYHQGSYLDLIRSRLSPRARSRVSFAGRVPHDRVAEHYENADIFVFPSIFEAFPIPPLEAMAAGLPVVASAVGGTVESVQHRETGLLVARGSREALVSAIDELVRDPVKRSTLGAAGRRRVASQFSWDSVCESFLELVLNQRARP